MKAKRWVLILSCVSGCGATPGAKQPPQSPSTQSAAQSGATNEEQRTPADRAAETKPESAGAPGAAPAPPPAAAAPRVQSEPPYAEPPPSQGARDEYNRASIQLSAAKKDLDVPTTRRDC